MQEQLAADEVQRCPGPAGRDRGRIGLAAADRALDHHGHRPLSYLVDELGADQRGQLRVAGRLGEQAPQRVDVPRPPSRHDRAQEADEVIAQAAGVGHVVRRRHVPHQRGEHQLGPPRPAPVEDGLAGPGAVGDGADGQPGVPGLGELGPDGVEDRRLQHLARHHRYGGPDVIDLS
nr:hypothetical protein [Jiangella aurantiaca]